MAFPEAMGNKPLGEKGSKMVQETSCEAFVPNKELINLFNMNGVHRTLARLQ